jgi:hypothetical protein
MSELLTTAEFERAMRTLERTISRGFERTDERFNAVDDKIDAQGQRLAIVESRDQKAKAQSVGFGTVAGGVVVAMVEVFRRVWN